MIQWFSSTPNQKKTTPIKDIIKSLGLVFGDIGTSPIYTLSIVFLATPVNMANVLGVLSLITWTLLLLVLLEYSTLVMSLGKKGEGGTIVLKELLVPLLKSGRQVAIVSFLAIIGISLFFGDGVITPAISILSAIEGLRGIPALNVLPNFVFIVLAICIAISLFAVQKRGTDRVSAAFGPLMVVWFLVLSVSGIASLINTPSMLNAINPYHALKFITNNGLTGFFILSEVILCATGTEALYADMGHLGRKPIQQAGYFVFFALILTYLGQGAFLLAHPTAKNILFEMIFDQAFFLYTPFVFLSLAATIIASQAMISGIFSIVYQGIMTKILPTLRVDYTSSKFRSQIYVGVVNWFLLVAVILIILHFKEAHKLAAIYGISVTGTMLITGILMSWIFFLRKSYLKATLSVFLTSLNFLFFSSSIFKIPHGGYWSVILALFPCSIILIYTRGRKKMHECLQAMSLEIFTEKYDQIYPRATHIKGTALFFAKDLSAVEPYIVQTMFKNNIMYEENILVSLITRDDPFGVIGFFKGDLAHGLRMFEIHMGYMEIIEIEKILSNAGINAKVIFYGLADIVTKNPFWKTFAIIKRITPAIVQFYRLPPYKLHGVVTLIDMDSNNK